MALWTFTPNTTCDIWIRPRTPTSGPPDHAGVPLQQLRSYVIVPSAIGTGGTLEPIFFYRAVFPGTVDVSGKFEGLPYPAIVRLTVGPDHRDFDVWSTTEQLAGTALNVTFATMLRNHEFP